MQTVENSDPKTEKRGRGNPAWKTGISSNPGGRGKYSTMITDCLVARLSHPTDCKDKPKTNLQAIVNKLVEMAKQGQPQAVSMVYDRIEGKVSQPIETEQKITIVQLVLEASRMREEEQLKLANQSVIDNGEAITLIPDSSDSSNV